jgi:hypothetical protein
MWTKIPYDFKALSEGASYSGWNPTALENLLCVESELQSIPGRKTVYAFDNPLRAVSKLSQLRINSTDIVDTAYCVISGQNTYFVYRYNSEWRARSLGVLATDTGYISFAESQSQNTYYQYLFIADGQSLYRVNLLDASSFIEDIGSSLPYVNGSDTEKAKPAYVQNYEHRLILTCANSSQWFYSKQLVDDSLEDLFLDTAFYSTESRADKTLAVYSLGMLYAIGTRSIETWSGTGGAYPYGDAQDDGPYGTQLHSALMFGCLDLRTITSLGESIYFIASGDGYEYSVIRLTGMNFEVISDPTITRQLKALKNFKAAFTVKVLGQPLVCWKAATGEVIAYNAVSNTWTHMTDWNMVENGFVDGFLCDSNGNFEQLDESCNMDTAKRIVFPMAASENRCMLREIDISYELRGIKSQVPLLNQFFFRHSPDGGQTWGDYRPLQFTDNAGTVKSFAFGFTRQPVFEILSTNANAITLKGFSIQIEETGR